MTSSSPRIVLRTLLVGVGLCLTMAACGSSADEGAPTTPASAETGTDTSDSRPSESVDSEPDNPVDGDVVEASESSWTATPEAYRQKLRTRIRYTCPPDGEVSDIWGSGTYTDDSPVCVAAVHTGLIDLDDGGSVVIMTTGSGEGFPGTTAHGITSDQRASAAGSFTFPQS